MEGAPDVTIELQAWGRMRPVNSPPNGYPTQTPFARLMGEGNVRASGVPLERLFQIDAAVGALTARSSQQRAILDYYYRHGLYDHQIAERMHISRSKVLGQRKIAENFIAGLLYAIDYPEDFTVPV